MRLLFILITSITTLLFGFSFTTQEKDSVTNTKFQSEYFYVLIIDGPRFTETFGDTTHRYIPHLGNELSREGVLMKHFYNNGPTYTNAGHTAITTGVYQRISNAGKELPKKPSFFQYYLKTTNADKTDAYIVSSKGKLEILANTKDKEWWNTYMPSTYCGPKGNSSEYVSDDQTFQKVNQLLESNPPHLMLINFLAVDSYGHSNEWDKYLNALVQCDEYAYQIWRKIQSNPILKDKTTLFITNDHGRHLDGHKNGFVNHGDKCDGCKQISLLALGPDFKNNVSLSETGELIDISKTIAYMGGFDVPTSKGRVLMELLK
jgi:predicted AlkP superfamily pyrophosphatase or phosphodiesterase